MGSELNHLTFASQWSNESQISQTGSPEHAVLRAVSIWLVKPQVANRRLFGSQMRTGSLEEVTGDLSRPSCLSRVLVPKNHDLANAEESVEWRPDLREWRFVTRCPRDGHKAVYAITLGDPNESEPFSVRLDQLEAPENWLFDRLWFSTDLFDRLNHWYSQALVPSQAFSSGVTSPMHLIDVERYVTIHRGLKEKYGRDLIANWSEKTSAEKFVFEDLSIAAYLLSLWENAPKPIRFVDLGCGNGLLVHLLLSEGIFGIGLDVRKRGIWSQFPATTGACLREATLDPSSEASVLDQLPADSNWLIGNHSDELTPWLPVLAARLSPSCAFFVLPCCPHDLFGKFAPRSKGLSRYRTYLDFVGTVGTRCGFRMEQDIMRIPSTRRTCWVGWPGAQGDQNRVEQLQRIKEMVEERRGSHQFAPRPAVEPVLNCTKLRPELREEVTGRVFAELLVLGEPKRPKLEAGAKFWNGGGEMALGDVSRLFDRTVLAELKAQHGGLQTLLRNHHQAFDVRGGTVRIRRIFQFGGRSGRNAKEAAEKERQKASRRKTKPCWMLRNHPDGCPRTCEECPFSHEDEDILEGPKMTLKVK